MIGRRDFICAVALLGGAAAVWPLTTRAQQPMPVIGWLSSRSPNESAPVLAAFREGLQTVGYREGQNVVIEYRWAKGNYGRLRSLASEIIARQVKVLVAVGGEAAPLAAKAMTSTIPIVFNMGGDPVKLGLVESYNRPGGNATGSTIQVATLEGKRLELLHAMLPHATKVGILLNPSFPQARAQRVDVLGAARALGLQLEFAPASTVIEIKSAFDEMAQRKVDAFLMASDPFFYSARNTVVALAAWHGIPGSYHLREMVEAGGFTSYGPSLAKAYRQIGIYTGRILKGARPSDLPVFQPTEFELVVNLKTAKALGLAIPEFFLARADEVIE